WKLVPLANVPWISGPWITTSCTRPWSTSVKSCENEMSCAVVRWPGFWNSVNSASKSKTMITHRAKLRRLAFIRRPDPAAHEPRGYNFYAFRSWRLHVGPANNVGSTGAHEKAPNLNILVRFRLIRAGSSARG